MPRSFGYHFCFAYIPSRIIKTPKLKKLTYWHGGSYEVIPFIPALRLSQPVYIYGCIFIFLIFFLMFFFAFITFVFFIFYLDVKLHAHINLIFRWKVHERKRGMCQGLPDPGGRSLVRENRQSLDKLRHSRVCCFNFFWWPRKKQFKINLIPLYFKSIR